MRVLNAIFLSLLIHFTFVQVVVQLSKLIPQWLPQEKKDRIEIEIVNSTEEKKSQGPVIRPLDLPELLKTQKARNQYDILAEQMIRVKEQLQAMRSGITQNRGNKNPQPSNSSESTKGRQRSPHSLTLKASDLLEGLNIDNRAQNTNAISFEEAGQSTLGMLLPEGIKAGLFTAVNTDRYLYSSYYNRAEELTLPEWSPALDFIIRNPPNALSASIHRRFSGIVEVWSKNTGEIIAVKLLKSFGIEEFDRSLLEAFRRVKVIPNPPKDKIGPDGIARVQMGGYISVDPKVLGRR